MTRRKLAQESRHLGLGPAIGRGGFGCGGVGEGGGRGGGVWFGHRDKVTDVVRVGKLLGVRVCRARQVGSGPQPRLAGDGAGLGRWKRSCPKDNLSCHPMPRPMVALERDDMALTRLDGVDFGLWRGVRRERCHSIVIDEQRCPQAKIGPPQRGCPARPCEQRCGSCRGNPCCAPRLVTGPCRTIRAVKCHVITL